MSAKLVSATVFAAIVALAPAAVAQTADAEANQAIVVENITALTETLRENIASLDVTLASADDTLSNAPAVLDGLLASVEEMTDVIAEDGETWTRLNALIVEFESERTRVADRANQTGNATLQRIASMWDERVETVFSLREDISRERARTRALLLELGDEREIVVELIKVGAADMVIENMRAIRDNLVAVNDDMQVMLDKAQQIEASVQN